MSEKKWYHRIGPGLITACVVIGPGSILTSSKVGATYGYSLSWVVLVAVAFMMVYTLIGAKLGVVAQRSPGQLITERTGRWLAVLIGASIFFIAAAFQFGNNLGVHSAFQVYLKDKTLRDVLGSAPLPDVLMDFPLVDYVLILFNLLSIGFLFLFKNLYRALERLMMFFVAMMLLAFLVNLVAARPNLFEWLKGFFGIGLRSQEGGGLDLTVVGLVGTTFVIGASYYQAYLVQQKGWQRSDLPSGLLDARIGAVIMALITLMIMTTAASVLRGQQLGEVKQVAQQLQPLFGGSGQLIFCLGLFSAAYSSFLVNSMVGGFILSDGLGLGHRPDEKWPKLLTSLVLLTGMAVAMVVIRTGTKPVGAIVAAQAVTVIAAPLMAGTLWWLSNRKDIMGSERNGILTNALAGLGFVMLLIMAYYTATKKVLPALFS